MFNNESLLRVLFDSILRMNSGLLFPFPLNLSHFLIFLIGKIEILLTVVLNQEAQVDYFSVYIHYLQIKNESETVWFSFNKSTKSFVDLKSSLHSLKENVSNFSYVSWLFAFVLHVKLKFFCSNETCKYNGCSNESPVTWQPRMTF